MKTFYYKNFYNSIINNENNEKDEIIDRSTENGRNKLLNGNDVNVDILPKVGGNSIIINVCSCFNWNYSNKKNNLFKEKAYN